MIKRFFLCLFFIIVAVATPSLVHAQTLPQGYTDAIAVAPASSGYYVSSLGGLINAALKWVAYIAGIILFVYLVWGGALWITSGGDKSKVEEGRTKITQSIIGFALLAVVFVGYGAVLDLLGLRCKVGIGNIGAGTCAGTNAGSGTVPTNPPATPTGSTCNSTTIGQTFNDGGAGGYCTNGGSATVKCVASYGAITYPHFEPCSCTTSMAPGVSTAGCQ